MEPIERIGSARIAKLNEPVVMDADVAHQNGVGGQRLIDLVRSALRVDRGAVVAPSRRDERIPLLAISVDRLEPLRAGSIAVAPISPGVELSEKLAQERAHVRHQAESDRVVAGDLVGIDVHMNKLGRGNGERVAREPRARCAVVKAHSQREQHIGGAGGMIGLVGTVAGDESKRQRMVGVDGAGAARGPGHGNAQPLCKA